MSSPVYSSLSYNYPVTHGWNLKRSTMMKKLKNNNNNKRICLCDGVRGGVHLLLSVKCNSNSEDNSSPAGGFGQSNTGFNDKKKNKNKNKKNPNTNNAPGLSPAGVTESTTNRLRTTNTTTSSPDFQFEQRLQAIKRSALEQKKLEQQTTSQFGAIDYDQPPPQPNTNSTDLPKPINLGTKIGVGVAVVIFGLVFALGDFLPTIPSPSNKADVVNSQLSAQEKETLQARLQQFEAALSATPKDSTAVEGAAVTLAELGEYSRAASLLEDLTKMKPKDPDAFRLLGEVRYQLKDYQASAAAYKTAAMVSKSVNFEVVRGLTNSLLAAKRPEEAVQVLLVTRERLSENKMAGGSTQDAKSEVVDPVQVELLLGKAYSDWGHVSDAVSVYDQVISTHPDDFRGYLAKGIILKENGRAGDAERMFIQARFFAPEKAKALVDRYSRT